ncbi:odorant receptor 13a-like isoform X3 [Nomia melanderi]|uniref:odorant receptor 13a-like isoform X3 n=1 Tax=Nomia melanderi TaxID=2448451 RepID=UPI003FCD5F33
MTLTHVKSGESLEIKDSLVFSKWAFSLAGLWPLKRVPAYFALAVVYLSVQIVLCVWDAVYIVGNLPVLVVNMLEWTLFLTMTVSMVLVFFNKNLKLLVDGIKEEISDRKFCRNVDERRLYHRYYNIYHKFCKYGVLSQLVVAALVFFLPLMELLGHVLSGSNSTHPYKLAVSAHILLDYQYNTGLYCLLYLYQFPLLYVIVFHIAEVSIIITMTLHLCGKLSMLSYRIRNIPTKPSDLFQKNMKGIVKQHLGLIKLSQILNDSFYLLLLVDYMGCTFRLSLSMYVALTTLPTDPMAVAAFCMYAADMINFLFLYSYVGEQLVFESQKVGESLCAIEWANVTNKDRKTLLMCMMNGQQTMYLTAGKFYKFSLFGFTNIVKFSVGFLSMLQASS